MSERICVAKLSQEDVDDLRRVYDQAKRVHKSLPAAHPARAASRELSRKLERINRRGVTIDELADTLSVSHQAVRSRIQKVRAEGDATAPDTTRIEEGPVAESPEGAGDVVLVLDSGIHRRLRVYEEPTTLDYVIPSIPILSAAEVVTDWLETESEIVPSQRTRPTATPLRTPPAVYVTRDLADTVLVDLSTEGAKS